MDTHTHTISVLGRFPRRMVYRIRKTTLLASELCPWDEFPPETFFPIYGYIDTIPLAEKTWNEIFLWSQECGKLA